MTAYLGIVSTSGLFSCLGVEGFRAEQGLQVPGILWFRVTHNQSELFGDASFKVHVSGHI